MQPVGKTYTVCRRHNLRNGDHFIVRKFAHVTFSWSHIVSPTCGVVCSRRIFFRSLRLRPGAALGVACASQQTACWRACSTIVAGFSSSATVQTRQAQWPQHSTTCSARVSLVRRADRRGGDHSGFRCSSAMTWGPQTRQRASASWLGDRREVHEGRQRRIRADDRGLDQASRASAATRWDQQSNPVYY
jgi:hypothetical protein